MLKMRNFSIFKKKKAQTAIEYILLLATVMAIVLIGLKTYLPTVMQASNVYYNRVAVGILGEPSHCGNGNCDWPFEDAATCPLDCP